MNVDINNLPESREELHRIIAHLNTYKQKYDQLVEAIQLSRQRSFAPSSEKNVAQVDMFDEPGMEVAEEIKRQLEENVEVQGHHRKKHPKREALPDYLPREIIVHDIPEEEKICPCGERLVKIGEEKSEQLKYIPADIKVIEHIRPKYACKPCQETVKIAPMPKLFLPKSIATPELVAYTIVAKYSDHLPLYRQSAIWTRMEVDLPRSSLCSWVLKTAKLCEPLIEELRKILLRDKYLQADETRIQVLGEAGRKNTTQSYMWCYRGGGKIPSIIFNYQETRGGIHPQRFLEGYSGYLQCDAYSGYHWANKTEKIVLIGCHAHARRPFAELSKLNNAKGLSTEAIKFYRQLYAVEKEARESILTNEQRYELRKKKSETILELFKKWLDHHCIKTSEQGKIGKAIRYCLSNWKELTRYLEDGRIEIDNNLIENAIRPFAIGRKNWLFSGSPEGAKAGATLYSLIETCKANKVEPYRYFCTMLNKIRDCQGEEDYRKLLPQFIEL